MVRGVHPNAGVWRFDFAEDHASFNTVLRGLSYNDRRHRRSSFAGKVLGIRDLDCSWYWPLIGIGILYSRTPVGDSTWLVRVRATCWWRLGKNAF